MQRIIFFVLILSSVLLSQEFSYTKLGMDTTSNVLPKGLAVGDNAPGFSGFDQNRKAISLSEILKEKPVVLIFYRGQWCPICMPYLKHFSDSLQLIRDKGAEVIAVSPETVVNVNKTIFKTKIDLPVISDPTNKIMKDYDVFFNVTKEYVDKIENKYDVNIAENNNQERAALPVPATYIIDQTGRIYWRQFNPNYKKRASIKDILKNLPN